MLNKSDPQTPKNMADSLPPLGSPRGALTTKRKGALYQRVARTLQTRILHGDYSLKSLPSERKLAEEFGINFMTVRRSLRTLEKQGLLTRQPNGRLTVRTARQGQKRHFNFAMIMPSPLSWGSGKIVECMDELQRDSGKISPFSYSIRHVLISHWDDPTLLDSLKMFDGIFLYPFENEPPAGVMTKLRSADHPVVVLDHDFTRYGIPSIQFFPPVLVQKLLDHLEKQGHRTIGCFNTQSPNAEIHSRINQWRLWMAAHGFTGRLVDKPVELYHDTGHHAHHQMKELLKNQPGNETAWLGVTFWAAVGAVRAMSDLGIRAGVDVAVCAINGEGIADLLVPSITALEQPDMKPSLMFALKWMLTGKSAWQGPLLLQPDDAPVVVRDSTRKIFPKYSA